jgi:hypothetical protein
LIGTYGAVVADVVSDVDVEASGPEGDAELVEDDDVLVAALSVMGNCAGVEVDETNGKACWMYEPSGWRA